VSGPTFAGIDGKFDSTIVQLIATYLDFAHARVIGVGVPDLCIGDAALSSIATKTKCPLVATNVQETKGEKKLFATHARLSAPGGDLLVLSLTAVTEECRLPAGYAIVNPETAIRRTLATARKGGETIVLLTNNLRKDDVLQLAARFPEVNVVQSSHVSILRCESLSRSPQHAQDGKHQNDLRDNPFLYVTTDCQNRNVIAVDLRRGGDPCPIEPAYASELGASWASLERVTSRHIAFLSTSDALKEELSYWQALDTRLRDQLQNNWRKKPPQNRTAFSAVAVDVRQFFRTPTNEVTGPLLDLADSRRESLDSLDECRTSSDKNTIELASAHLHLGEWADTIQLAAPVVQAQGFDATKARELRVIAETRSGRWEDAIRDFAWLIRDDEALQGWALDEKWIACDLGRLDQACSTQLRQKPNDADALLVRGVTREYLGNDSAALADFSVLANASDVATKRLALERRLHLFTLQGKPLDAARDACKWCRLDPSTARRYADANSYATFPNNKSYWGRRFASLAAAALLESLRHNPRDAELTHAYANICAEALFLGLKPFDFTRTQQAFTEATQGASNPGPLWCELGALAYHNCEWGTAVSSLSNASHFNSDSLLSHQLLAKSFIETGWWERAAQESEVLARVAPSQPDYWYTAGSMHCAAGRFNEAQIALTTYIEKENNQYSAYETRAVAETQLHDWDHARADLDKAMQLATTDFEKAIILIDRGDLEAERANWTAAKKFYGDGAHRSTEITALFEGYYRLAAIAKWIDHNEAQFLDDCEVMRAALANRDRLQSSDIAHMWLTLLWVTNQNIDDTARRIAENSRANGRNIAAREASWLAYKPTKETAAYTLEPMEAWRRTSGAELSTIGKALALECLAYCGKQEAARLALKHLDDDVKAGRVVSFRRFEPFWMARLIGKQVVIHATSVLKEQLATR
jgi:tetratricopeptide (TPR) repeat protein